MGRYVFNRIDAQGDRIVGVRDDLVRCAGETFSCHPMACVVG
jgi:hypothetical protein